MPDQDLRAPTIYDVAREAGVAASTVSRAFARPGRVNSLTAERVRSAAELLGYRTTSIPRGMPTSRSSVVVLSISDVTNPFYADIIRGARQALKGTHLTMVLTDGQESDVLEREALDRTLPAIEGLILGTSRLPDAAICTLAKQKPVIVLNRNVTDVPSLVTDNLGGVRVVVEHLQSFGHRAITYLAGPEASWADGVRWRALRTAAAEANIRTRRLGPFAPTYEGGQRAAQELIDNPATAVLAYNDQMAIGLIRTFAAAGVDVPGQVSVVGFDDIFAARLITPALTTVAAALSQMGAIAVRNLVAMIGGAKPRAREPLVVPTHLVERQSTGPACR